MSDSKPTTPAPPPNRHRLSPEELEALREDDRQAKAWFKSQLAAEDTRLSPSELASLKLDAKQASEWAKAQMAKIDRQSYGQSYG